MTLIFPWWTPPQQDGRTCLKEKNFSNSCQQWVGSRTHRRHLCSGWWGVERGAGVWPPSIWHAGVTQPPVCPAFWTSWVSNERFSGFSFCLPGARPTLAGWGETPRGSSLPLLLDILLTCCLFPSLECKIHEGKGFSRSCLLSHLQFLGQCLF